MHMSDALLNPIVAGSMYALTTGVAVYSLHNVRKSEEQIKVAEMGIMGAFVFAAQMINFSIPGTGSSGHLCGGMLISAMLGPHAGFLTMIGILIIQCLLFADGGIMALGANIWNMAFFGCFVGAAIIWRSILKKGVSKKRIIIASVAGCVVTLQLGAFFVTLETMASNVTELPFQTFLAFMLPIHLAIGLVEGFITAAILCFVYETRSELLWGIESGTKEDRKSYAGVMSVLGVTALAVAGMFSLMASSHPDGLEWSVEKVTGSTELVKSGEVYEAFASIQEKLAILPDYAFKNSDTIAGTSFSGIIGAIIVAGICTLLCVIVRLTKKKS
ncbi:MAG: energy-coupling factor ABC transporter permease [Lachnospiraceae bacterium]|nr:energy-coupling factor ABC transporter permease [Lachnospiraceae bacterium]